MSSIEAPLTGLLHHTHLLSICLTFVSLYIVSLVASSVYNAYFGPLSHFPGPLSGAFTTWAFIRTTWNGEDNADIPALHRQYGKVVRVAPNQLSFVGDGQIWKDIYGFRKHNQLEVVKDPTFYGQTINRTPGLITADASTHSRQRKLVSHAFSDKALKEQEPMLKGWAEKLRARLAEHAARGEKSDMLKLLNWQVNLLLVSLSKLIRPLVQPLISWGT